MSEKEQKQDDSGEAQKTEKHKNADPQKECEELKDTLKRLAAEFDNYKKRVEQDKAYMQKSAAKEVIKNILPIKEDFERALIQKENPEEFAQGIELIHKSLHDLLVHYGVEEISTKGEFNPNLHEALMAEESEEKENTIIAVFQKGYTLHGDVLQHAKVKVAKKRNDATDSVQPTTEGRDQESSSQ